MRTAIRSMTIGAVLLSSSISATSQVPTPPPDREPQDANPAEQLRALLESIQPQVGVTVATLEALLDAFDRRDLDAIMGFFADDAVLDLPQGPKPWGARMTGKEQVRQALARRLDEMPDAHYSDARHLAAGDRGVSEWTLTGTLPSGERVALRGCHLLQFRDGKVVRMDSFRKIQEP